MDMERRIAQDKGQMTYYTGKKCKHGHLSERYTKSGTCVACAKRRATLWRIKERDRYNSYHSNYNTANLKLIEKYLKDPNELWFEKRTRRRKSLKQATPHWVDPIQIHYVYEECLRLTKHWHLDFMVDHHIPLKGRKVSGLHVPSNLRVVSHNYKYGRKNRFNSRKESKDLLKWLKQRGL